MRVLLGHVQERVLDEFVAFRGVVDVRVRAEVGTEESVKKLLSEVCEVGAGGLAEGPGEAGTSALGEGASTGVGGSS